MFETFDLPQLFELQNLLRTTSGPVIEENLRREIAQKENEMYSWYVSRTMEKKEGEKING